MKKSPGFSQSIAIALIFVFLILAITAFTAAFLIKKNREANLAAEPVASSPAKKLSSQDQTLKPDMRGKELLKGWRRFRFEKYGFEFQLPDSWHQIESEAAWTATATILAFAPKYTEFENEDTQLMNLEIYIWENYHAQSFPALLGLENDEVFMGSYNKSDNVIVGGLQAKIMYDVPDYKSDPIVIVPHEGKYIDIMPPKEEWAYYNIFTIDQLLSTFVFFKSDVNAQNSSQPDKPLPKEDPVRWCSSARVPSACILGLIAKTDNPDKDFCDNIKIDSRTNFSAVNDKNYCFEQLAMKIGEPEICERIKGEVNPEILGKTIENRKMRVFYLKAVNGFDVSYCDKIIKTVFDLNELDHIDDREVSKTECYLEIAKQKNDISLCDNLDANNDKYKTIGRYHPFKVSQRDYCQLELAKHLNDCGLINKEKNLILEKCYYGIAYNANDCSIIPPEMANALAECKKEAYWERVPED